MIPSFLIVNYYSFPAQTILLDSTKWSLTIFLISGKWYSASVPIGVLAKLPNSRIPRTVRNGNNQWVE